MLIEEYPRYTVHLKVVEWGTAWRGNMGSMNTGLIPVGGGSLIGHPGQIVDTNISLVGESGKEGGEGRLEAGDACVLRT